MSYDMRKDYLGKINNKNEFCLSLFLIKGESYSGDPKYTYLMIRLSIVKNREKYSDVFKIFKKTIKFQDGNIIHNSKIATVYLGYIFGDIL